MSATPRRGFPAVAGWACFLGSSWTWVIGMILPALLVRDYGLLGWVVFAIPNVVGAAAMGFVLRNETISKRVAAEHRAAGFWFSIVTLGFHLYVVAWLFPKLFGFGLGAMVLPIVAWFALLRSQDHGGNAQHTAGGAGATSGVGTSGGATAVLGGILVSALSYGAFIFAQDLPGAWTGAAAMPDSARLGWSGLAWFAPAAIVGFALCPYLDLTFHRARQHTDPVAGRGAFAAGFGIVFFLMIGFSLCYAGLLAPAIAGGEFAGPRVWLALLGIHLGLQVTYTCGLHLREVERADLHAGQRIAAVALLLGAMVLGGFVDRLSDFAGLTPGEVGYRGFMLCYGTVFPAYVWLCMIPTRRPAAKNLRLGVYAVATVIAAPMGFLGFTTGPGWWFGGALGVLVVARGVIEAAAWRGQG